jgi:multicomponent K+:H+ antiporter subunit D
MPRCPIVLLLGGHEIVLPIVLPLVAGALLLCCWRRPVALGALVCAAAAGAGAAPGRADGAGRPGAVQAYLLGNWRAPWGIALALDRLSALMLLLTALVANARCGMRWPARTAQGRAFPLRCSSSS